MSTKRELPRLLKGNGQHGAFSGAPEESNASGECPGEDREDQQSASSLVEACPFAAAGLEANVL